MNNERIWDTWQAKKLQYSRSVWKRTTNRWQDSLLQSPERDTETIPSKSLFLFPAEERLVLKTILHIDLGRYLVSLARSLADNHAPYSLRRKLNGVIFMLLVSNNKLFYTARHWCTRASPGKTRIRDCKVTVGRKEGDYREMWGYQHLW